MSGNHDLIDSLRSQIAAIESHGSTSETASRTRARRRSPQAPSVQCNHLDTTDVLTHEGSGAHKAFDERVPNENDALKKIVALVNVSERSEHAVRERLANDGFDETTIDEAVSKALSYGLVDDKRFASILIRSRISQGKGTAGIKRELESHGIDIDSVPGWPYEFQASDESEEDRAYAFLESHPTRSKNKREGAYRKLIQRGFSSSVAASVARTWSESCAN